MSEPQVPAQKHSHPWGRAALAMLALAGIVVATWAYFSTRGPQRENGQIDTPGRVKLAALHPGDCVNLPTTVSSTSKRLTVVPCETPHNAQVFALISHAEIAFPGGAQAAATALGVCESKADAYLGHPRGPLGVRAIVPGTEKAWAAGDHTEVCLLVDRTRTFIGDIRNLQYTPRPTAPPSRGPVV